MSGKSFLMGVKDISDITYDLKQYIKSILKLFPTVSILRHAKFEQQDLNLKYIV